MKWQKNARNKQLAPGPLALTAVQPLPFAQRVKQVALEAQEHEDGKQTRDKLVTAFVNMYGPSRVRYEGHSHMQHFEKRRIESLLLHNQ